MKTLEFFGVLRALVFVGAVAGGFVASAAEAANAPAPWMDARLSPDQRARLLDAQLTLDERIGLVHGVIAAQFFGPLPPGAIGSAGFVPGVPRLGVPPLQESDASLGVANIAELRPGDRATALPSTLAVGASFDPTLAYAAGAMVGREARGKGFNVLLGGGANLIRDPRGGRAFEYYGEDPLLTGTLAGEAIRGTQDQHVISTTKHFALNDQETGRMVADVELDPAAARESDLLAFELAIERGHPGAVMCAYNKVGGLYACTNPTLLGKVLKSDWGFPGWVMSDWGAVHDVKDASAGLDQESGDQADKQVYFDKPLKDAVQSGQVSPARLSDMSRRILRSMFAEGLIDDPPKVAPIDYAANADVARHVEEQGIVLLANRRDLLPLSASAKSIVVIGGHADAGVLSGGGSSQVLPVGGPVTIPLGGDGMQAQMMRNMVFDPSSPLAAIRAKAPNSQVTFDDGRYVKSAVDAAKAADVAIVFATQWQSEGQDAPDLSLPGGQDALIAAVTGANPHAIVVLETGGPVLMPWLDQAGAVVEAWYGGQKGGEAIADMLFGDTDPSGRLPVSFPASEDQLPDPQLAGVGLPANQSFDVHYAEGADVGYRWYAAKGLKPLFPFGYGLSYTRFAYSGLHVESGKSLAVGFTVTNTGVRAGEDAPQVYLTAADGARRMRLIGFQRVSLKPGESREVSISVDPRLLADFDAQRDCWRLAGGRYDIAVGASSADLALTGEGKVAARSLKP